MTDQELERIKKDLEIKRLRMKLDQWENKSFREKYFPELSGIPVIWLIIGGIALFINLFSLIV